MYKLHNSIYHEEQGVETAGGHPMGEPTQLVMGFGGGERRVFAFGCMVIRDPIDELAQAPSELSPFMLAGLDRLASLLLDRDNVDHSKPWVAWARI
jgi:hypothetical protein